MAAATQSIGTAAAPTAPSATLAAAAAAAAPLQGGVVRSCPSGDTLIVRPRGVATPGAEHTIHIAGIAAPRMGTRDRDDEPFAFPSREYLRKLLVGREVRFRVEYTVPFAAGGGAGASGGNGGGVREYCHVFLPPELQGGQDTNVSHKILRAGWARVHDSAAARRNGSNMTIEEEEEGGWKAIQRTVQDEAQKDAVGVWGPDDLLRVEHSMADAAEFLAEWKGKELESVVEQVRDGSMLRVRLLLSSRHHQIVNLSLAGIKAPRVASGSDASEPFAEEARFFVESRLLQRNVRVTILALPQTTAPTPFSLQPSASSTNPGGQSTFSSSVLIGQVMHPVGDIAQFLLAAGLAKCVDWHAGMLSTSAGGMEKYRVAEKTAKDKRLNVWRDYRPPVKSADALPASPQLRNFEAIVVRVISGDTVHVRRADAVDGTEQRMHLSSIRQPLVKDEKQAGYAFEARELLRKRLVGKPVQVRVDYIKKESSADDRLFATLTATTGAKESRDVGETLLQRGLATVTRHRMGDEDRSPEWDRLMAVEAEASAAQRGIHSGKELAAPKYVDASESAAKANAFLATLKRSAKVHANVDFCASASRFKLVVPREQCRLTFILAGIRAPRTARNPSEKDEPFAREGLHWSTSKVLQRDVDVEFYSTDKVGGFIGAILLNNKSENVAVSLVEQGLASVHHYSAESLPFGQQLIDAEERAKKGRLGMWLDADLSDEEDREGALLNGSDAGVRASSGTTVSSAATSAVAAPWAGATSNANARSGWRGPSAAANAATPAVQDQARTEYVDIMVSDVRGDGGASVPFGFSVQILNNRIQELERLMQELSLSNQHAANGASSTTAVQPKVGDWVVARFSGDGQWYRGQVLRNKAAQRAREIVFVDYGNIEDVGYGDIRPLDETKFGKRRLPGQASPARLSFVKLYEGRGVQAQRQQAGPTQQASGTKQKQALAVAASASAQPSSDEYALEALDRFRELAEGRKLIANVDMREPNGLLHLTLYDPSDAQAIAQGRAEACINADLCKEGHATPDKRVPYWRAYANMTKAVEEAHQDARRRHRGMFELGDPTGDE